LICFFEAAKPEIASVLRSAIGSKAILFQSWG
jgi:hypothetical protein